LSEGANPNENAYADASPFQPKQKPPLLERAHYVAVHRSARVTPGVVVYRLDDRLFFANPRYVESRVLEAVRGAPTTTRSLVFDAEAVAHVDATGLDALRKNGKELSVAPAKTPLTARLAEFGLSGIPLNPTVRAAVEAAV
jgi:SulP family sulfate permease